MIRRYLALTYATLLLASPAAAANYLLHLTSRDCFAPVVYTTLEACQAAGDALAGAPAYECVTHTGNNLPPTGISPAMPVCPSDG